MQITRIIFNHEGHEEHEEKIKTKIIKDKKKKNDKLK